MVKALVKKLVTADLSKRYGNLKAGSDDILGHSWFKGLDLKKMEAKEITPPYKPQVKDDKDMSNIFPVHSLSQIDDDPRPLESACSNPCGEAVRLQICWDFCFPNQRAMLFSTTLF